MSLKYEILKHTLLLTVVNQIGIILIPCSLHQVKHWADSVYKSQSLFVVFHWMLSLPEATRTVYSGDIWSTSVLLNWQTNKHFLGYSWQVTDYRWHVTGDRWQMTDDRWQIKDDRWKVTRDTWHVTSATKYIYIFFLQICLLWLKNKCSEFSKPVFDKNCDAYFSCFLRRFLFTTPHILKMASQLMARTLPPTAMPGPSPWAQVVMSWMLTCHMSHVKRFSVFSQLDFWIATQISLFKLHEFIAP